MCELFEHSFEDDCFPSTFSTYKYATDQKGRMLMNFFSAGQNVD